MEGKVFLVPKFAIQILAQWRTVSVQNINKAFVKKSKVEERISSQKMLKRFGEEEEEKAQKRFLKKNWSSKTNFWHFSSIPLSLSLPLNRFTKMKFRFRKKVCKNCIRLLMQNANQANMWQKLTMRKPKIIRTVLKAIFNACLPRLRQGSDKNAIRVTIGQNS